MHARDRRDAALRPAHPADRVDHAVAAAEPDAVQHAHPLRACRRRRSRTRASPRSRRPRTRRRSTTSTSRASRITCTTSSPRAVDAFNQFLAHERLWLVTAARRPARPSGRALALAADAERRVRGGRARLALLGLRRRGLRSRRSRAADARLRRRERHDPAQAAAVVAACDEAEGDAVNTLVFRDGRVLGFNTDKEILAGIDARRAPA